MGASCAGASGPVPPVTPSPYGRGRDCEREGLRDMFAFGCGSVELTEPPCCVTATGAALALAFAAMRLRAWGVRFASEAAPVMTSAAGGAAR